MLLSAPALVLALGSLLSGSLAIRIPQESLARPAIPDDWTNAQRLAAGLPPHPPRFLKRATRTESQPGLFKRAVPSASPSPVALANIRMAATDVEPTHTGRILARTVADNFSVGFVQSSSSAVSLDGDEDTRVSFTAIGSTPFSLEVRTPVPHDGESPAYLGAIGQLAIASGSASTATLSHVPRTSPHARPGPTGSESAIWTLDATTQKLAAHWVNPDGSHPRTKLAYSAARDALVLTGDVGAYNLAHPDAPADEVALYFVSD